MIKKAFGDDSVGEVQIKFWYLRFKDGQEPLKAIHVLEGLQQAELSKMLNTCRLQSTKIGD